MLPTIDAHQHFWELGRFDTSWLETPEHAPIHSSFLPSDLKPLLDEAGIGSSIFVQTQHNVEENRWVLGLAEANDWLAGVVGWVDLASEDCEAQLLEFRDHPKFVGVRHITQDEPDDDFIIRPEVLRGLRVLERHRVPFDLLFYVKHLRHAATLARQLPDLPMVLDHLAKPEIKHQNFQPWRDDLREASRFPNIHCKLSGMVTEAAWNGWTVEDLRPYVDTALECFGPQRLMYGSDWPVCLLAGTYGEVHAALRTLLEQLSPSEQEQIFHHTAREFYGLS